MYNLDGDVPTDELNSAIVQELRLLGLKHGSIPKRINKSNQNSKAQSRAGCIFRKPLAALSSRIVPLQSGVDAKIPNIIQELCCCIVQQAGVEGLFRKAGSSVRQKEIRAMLEQGHKVQFLHHHVIDVANILKYFLRELTEPVLPYAFHDLFLHCLLLDDTVAAVLLVCLLLPRPHLHVLAYLMEFFHLISGLSEANKMTISNIAIVITPSLMPVSEKVSVIQNPQRISAHVRIMEVLIANADHIGVLPDRIVGKLSLTPSVSNASLLSDDHMSGASFSSKKKRRRSGSLTRMFNGLKKIVAGKPSPGVDSEYSGLEEETALVPSMTDFSTPCVKSAKKRKAMDASSAFSSKKKRDVLMALPQSTTLADTPFKKASNGYTRESNETPRVCPNPNPAVTQKSKSKSPQKNKNRKFFPTRTISESDNRKPGTKKGLSGVSNFVIKKQKQRSERHSTSGNFLERSWSAVSSSHWGRKKSRQSDQTRLSVVSTSSAYMPVDSDSSHDADTDIGIDLSQEDPFNPSPNDFVHVPKSEYEDLKTRMSAIESCITQEFNSMSTPDNKSSPEKMNAANTLQAVQTVYEKTLEGADIAKDVSTDQLAKRLSRELKIRRSVENRVIRSPSARKIGTIRRRSRERQSPGVRRELRRNKSWHMMQRPANVVALCTTVSSPETSAAQNNRLRRGRPNTVFSGLPQPTPNRVTKDTRSDDTIPILGADNSPVTRSQARRACSFHGSEASSPVMASTKKCRSQVNLAKAALLAHAQQKSKGNLEFDEKWRDAQELLNSSKDLLSGVPTTGRESIAKLRSENAGKVLATAKMFSASNETAKPVEGRRSRAHETSLRSSLGSRQGESSPCLKAEPSLSGSHETTDKSTNSNSTASKVQAPVLNNSSTCVQKTNDESRSPAVRPCNRRLRIKTSPSQSPAVRSSKLKKHSSMKVDRVAHFQPVRRNLSVPVQLIDCGKENQVGESVHKASNFPRGLSPQLSKETVPLTERIQRISVSPLKDCNRISVQPTQVIKYPSMTPCMTPNIKQPLRVLTPRQKAFTPQRVCAGNTPLKVMATSTFTPKHPTQQRQNHTRLHYATKAIKVARPCN